VSFNQLNLIQINEARKKTADKQIKVVGEGKEYEEFYDHRLESTSEVGKIQKILLSTHLMSMEMKR
jgi:hypothetical protein